MPPDDSDRMEAIILLLAPIIGAIVGLVTGLYAVFSN